MKELNDVNMLERVSVVGKKRNVRIWLALNININDAIGSRGRGLYLGEAASEHVRVVTFYRVAG